MPTYQGPKTVIEAIQFWPHVRPWPEAVRLREDGTYYVWHDGHSERLAIQPGDYVCIDNPLACYPIDKETFERTYRLIEENRALAR